MRVSSEYISIGSNRSSTCSACTSDGIIAYGADSFVALWDTEADDSRGVYATLPGHKGQVTTVKRIDRDGKEGFISGDALGEVRIWAEDRPGKFSCTHQFQAHPSASISALGVSPPGNGPLDNTIFTGGSDGCVRLWSLGEKVQELQKLDLKGKLPLDLEVGYLPGSTAPLVVIACTDRRIQIWTKQGDQFSHSISLEGHQDWIRCLSLTPYPSTSQTSSPSTSTFASTSSTPDLLLASGSQDNYIRLWRISPVEISSSSASTGGLDLNGGEDALDMLDEFERKLAGEAGGNVTISTKAHVLSVETPQGSSKFNVTLEALLMGHEFGLTNVHWSPSTPTSSPLLLSSASDNSLIIWSPSSSSAADTAEQSADGIWIPSHRFGILGGKGLAFFGALWGKDGESVLASGWNGGWEKWVKRVELNGGEEGDGELMDSWEPDLGISGHFGGVRSVVWDPKGEYLLSVGSDQTSRIHASCVPSSSTSPVWAEIARPQIHGYDMTDAAFIESFRFVSSADEKVTRVFDAPSGFVDSLGSLGVEGRGREGVVDPANRPKGASVPPLGLSNRALGQGPVEEDIPQAHVPTGGHVSVSKTLTNLPTEEELASSTLWPEVEKIYGHGYELVTLATSHDGQYIATACKATTSEHAVIRVISTKTWELFGEPLHGHNLTITRISFSHDDSRIISCSRDRGWRMFNRTENGYVPIAKDERAHGRMVLDIAWAPSGEIFATASRDKTVKIWHEPSTGESWVAGEIIKLPEAGTAVDMISVGDLLLLAIGLEGGGIWIYSVRRDGATISTDELLKLDASDAHVEAVNRLAWRRVPESVGGGIQLASCSDDKSVRVFEIHLDA